MAQWRRFAFFEKETVKNDKGKPWLHGVNVTCATANRGMLVFGDAEGAIHLADRQLEVSRFQAYEHFVSQVLMVGNLQGGVYHQPPLHSKNFLVTVGDGIDPRDEKEIKRSRELAKAARKSINNEEEYAARDSKNSTALVKIWRTDQQDRDGHPKLVQQIKVFAKYPEEAVTAFAVTEDLSHIAVGLKNGAVILFRSDIKKREQRPPVLLQPAAQHRVTALAFTEHQGSPTANASSTGSGTTEAKLFLYAATRRGLTSYNCSKDESKETAGTHRAVVLDERGVQPNCSAINDQGEIAVGQQDAVYFYTPEDRSVCFGFDGEKKYLQFFKHYLLVAHIDPRGRHQINVYDLKNKFVAFNWTLTQSESRTRSSSSSASGSSPSSSRGHNHMEKIREVVCEFGAIFVVTSVGNIYRLTEKDTASKLEILFRKNLYSIAISLAFSSNYDINNIMDIYRMYGDHLYKKCDYNGAVLQYSRTIGHIEPSYVIRRFLDAQRIHNLTTYLESLHEKAFASAEHTTLLLNCYTKLKDVKKLDAFICPTGELENGEVVANRTASAEPKNKTPNGKASSIVHTSLAKRSESFQLSNAPDGRPLDSASDSKTNNASGAGPDNLTFEIETAISVLRRNYPKHALYLAKTRQEHSWYLKILLEDISYVEASKTLKAAEHQRLVDALEYIQTLEFHAAEKNLKKYGRTLVTHLPEETTELLKKLCTGRYNNPTESNAETVNNTGNENVSQTKSEPAEFIHLYVSHPKYLKQFLEYIVCTESSGMKNATVGNTLLEMLLQEDMDSQEHQKLSKEERISLQDKREEAVMMLLDNPRVQYDDDHALILVQMHNIKKGKRYLYNKLHMYHMLIQHFMEESNDALVIEEIKKHGDKDPNLWLQGLKYYAERGSDKGGNWDQLKEVLDLIDANPVIPPLQVIQVVSQTPQVPLSVVRPYLLNRLQADEKRIEEDVEEIQKFKSDTAAMEAEMRELRSKASVFQSTKCDLCKYELDLPSIHFLCQHSFHQTCIPENERECLVCDQEHRHIQNVKISLEQKSANHEQFYNQLETSANGFQTIAEYFGKGIFKPEDPKKLETGMESRFSNEF